MKKTAKAFFVAGVLLAQTGCFATKEQQVHSKNNKDECIIDGVNVFAYEKQNFPARPEIKNGTFYLDNKPKFFIGPWLNDRYKEINTPLPIKGYRHDPVYKQAFNYEIAKQMGFSTCHPQMPAYSFAEKILSDKIKLSKVKKYGNDYFPTFIKGLKDMPLVLDFSCVGLRAFNGSRNRQVKGFSSDVFQQKDGWIVFVPFCHEHPLGKKIYQTYWQEGAKNVLKTGGNPWIYEIFNEPTYDCRCLPNKIEFIRRMKDKYASIEDLNKSWNSNFKSFEELVRNSNFERQKGLSVEWLKFIENRWIEILKNGIKTIREIDPRKKVYFSSQRNIWVTFLTTKNGFDEYKNARLLDVVNTEGGLHFSQGAKMDNNDPMSSHLKKKPQMYLDCCRAVAEGKPVIDTEFSTIRVDVQGRRIPSKRSDLTLALWVQAIHGSSLVQLYSWTKQLFLWPTKDLKGAKALVNKAKHAMCGLLNPVCFPKEALKGIKDFEREINDLAEIVLPNPRIKGKIALLLSTPTKRVTGSIAGQFENYYNALLSTHYPFDIIFEEQINKGMASKYKAIISPECDYVYSKTMDHLKEYVNNGGSLFLNGMDLAYNEYGVPLNNNDFIGIAKREAVKHPYKENVNMDDCSLETEVANKVLNGAAKTLINGKKTKQPVLLANQYGNGTVYYTPRNLNGISLTSLIVAILKNSNIHPPFTIESIDGSSLPAVEAQIIERGDAKLYFFANWRQQISELGILKTKLPKGKFYLSDPVSKTFYKSPSGEIFWTSSEIEKGIKILLPFEERVLLLLTSKEPSQAMDAIDQQGIEAAFRKRLLKDKIEQQQLKEKIKQSKAQFIKRNIYSDCIAAKCFSLDISKFCNMGFRDRIAGDKKGGAFDEGNNDLRYFPIGNRKFSNIPFAIIDPIKNKSKSMIVLRGRGYNHFPLRVNGIKVDRKVKYFYFLHTVAWGNGSFSYIINYADDSSKEILIRDGKEVGGWWSPAENKATEAKIAWEGKNVVAAHIGAYCFRYKNPEPGKTVKSIDIVARNNKIIPGILGITVEEPKSEIR